MTGGGLPATRDPVAVALPRPDAGHVDVPVVAVRCRISIRSSRFSSSNRQSSTPSAFSLKSEKFVPLPSQVGPSGNGLPGQVARLTGAP